MSAITRSSVSFVFLRVLRGKAVAFDQRQSAEIYGEWFCFSDHARSPDHGDHLIS